MSNMSYCRFENTARDLADCDRAIDNLLNGDEEALSASEAEAAKSLVERCGSIIRKLANHVGEDDEAIMNLDRLDLGEALVCANSEIEEAAQRFGRCAL